MQCHLLVSSGCSLKYVHWVKSIRIWSYSGPHFLSECGKILTRIIPNADTFHAVATSHSLPISGQCSHFVPTEGCNVTKKETPGQTFSCELYEILRRTLFCRTSSKQLLLKSLCYHKEWLFS